MTIEQMITLANKTEEKYNVKKTVTTIKWLSGNSNNVGNFF